MFSSVLCHRCGSMIKMKQFKSIILPERRVQTFSHHLPHTIPNDFIGTQSLKRRKKQTTKNIPFGGHLQSHCLKYQWKCAYRLPWRLWASYAISLRSHFPLLMSEPWHISTSQVCNDSYRHDWRPARHVSSAVQISKLVKQRGSFTSIWNYSKQSLVAE